MEGASSVFLKEVQSLTRSEAGYHFTAEKSSVEKIQECDIEHLGANMEKYAPSIWTLLRKLLQADPDVLRHRKLTQKRKATKALQMREAIIEPEATIQSTHTVIVKKQIVCLSIMMQNTNRKCNALQSLVGLFLQACGAPEAVVRLLSHLGVSIAPSTINNAIKSLSIRSEDQIRTTAATFTTAYAYDNLDINLKHHMPTLENSHESSIVHLTSSAMFPLNHGVHLSDLECSDRLHEIFFPMGAIPIGPSTPAQNAQVLENIFNQANIGDTNDVLQSEQNSELGMPKTIGNTAIIIFGDLLTGQHIRSLMQQRAEERSPFRRFQFMVYVIGLFHFKMACTDALWKQFIAPAKAKKGPNTLLSFISCLRKNDAKRLKAKADFRSMHEVVQHCGIVGRLDLWRIMIKKSTKGSCQTVEEWATKEPTWDEIYHLSRELAAEHVAPPDMDELRNQRTENRDPIKENMMLMHRQFLLYEETTYAMNIGDIGHLEATFLSWIHIFTGCGKHKYAAELKRYIENIHFRYPKGLSRAIRMNILCNPTGRSNGFRGIDWVIELNNLYIKRIHGGQFSNRTVDRMIIESPLIETYKNIRQQFENMFCLDHKTTRHSPADMKATFEKLAEYMRKEQSNEFVTGRTAEYEVQDVMAVGMQKMKDKDTVLDAEESADLEIEVDDDGSLDL
ncbi:hypothetical protein AGABI2DRAFT_79752 [Agaricus bisporus var. bisporus H97]|uniref:hypothetical protein n=1 Tax=Agaricus bisporus var. bisporus (strain H97 / ATCC MYA-4626 / FGSC 10389) TaxID=936046 RepID=UPI00029F5F18|nr:hypothetical protein AGABI2DRAFT_79752 [Agaricus bisporus var. bisporus H97]EKV41771.1 hypothetical protein AGABI2DRAFT_79752 [Agaricus bisporus var. bisporus H97]